MKLSISPAVKRRVMAVAGFVGCAMLLTAGDPAPSHPTAIEIWLAVAAMLSALGAVITMITGVALTKGRWKIDRSTIDKMEREREKDEADRRKEDEERNAQRKKDDEDRYRLRIEEDERRADALREEMAGLTRRNADQFEVILELRDEIAELRQWVAGTHRQWDNEAVQEVNRLGGHLRPPPELPARRKKRNNRDRDHDNRDDRDRDRDRERDRD